MAHPGPTPLPPTIQHASTPLTHASAHAILSSFLALAELDASLRPDSVLSSHGPSSASTAAKHPNLTLAHLGRIARGMRGERVGGGVDYDGNGNSWDGEKENGGVGRGKRKFANGEQLLPETPRKGKRARGEDGVRQDVETVEEGQDAGEPALVATSTGPAQREDEWQDRENYDLGQDDDEVDVGNAQRSAGVGGEDEEETIGMEGPGGEVVDARAVAGAADGGKGSEEEQGRSEVVDPNVTQGSGGSKLDKAERKRLKKEKSKREKKTARPG